MKKKKYNWIIGAIVGVIVVFLLPIFLNSNIKSIITLFFSNYNDIQTTLGRSLLFSIASTLGCVFIGFWGGFFLKSIPISSRYSYFLTLLFIPFLLGNVSIAFIYKIILLNGNITISLYETNSLIFNYLVCIQIWQYGSLFIYLFWMNFQSINKNQATFFNFYGMSPYERFKDVYFPHSSNLLILTSLIAFVFSFYEDAKSQIIFNSSQGTGTEMISQWLYRNYRSEMFFNYEQALNKVLGFSEFVIIPILLCSVLFLVLGVYSISNLFIKSKKYPLSHAKKDEKKKVRTSKVSIFSLILLALLIIAPIILVFVQCNISVENISDMISTLLYTLFAAVLSFFVATIFSYSLRIGFYRFMNNFNFKSLITLSFLFIILIIPPVSIMICGFKWTTIISQTSINQYFLWFIGHIFLCLPVLSGFLLVSYFRISNKELEYSMIYKMTSFDIFKFSFFKRFKVEYILSFIFSFSIIWNEAILNRVFSDDIPSFISRILITLNSRKADFSVGLLYFIISLLLALCVVCLWNVIIRKYNKSLHEINHNK